MVWLEPEGLGTDLVYPNGQRSAAADVQEKIVRSIVGLENVRSSSRGMMWSMILWILGRWIWG